MPPTERAEIEQAVGEELAKVGVEGTLSLIGHSIELHPGSEGGSSVARGAPVAIDIQLILEQWALLPDEMRARKAEEIARRLHGALRTSRRWEGHHEDVVDSGGRGRVAGAVAGLFGLLAVIGLARYFVPRVLGQGKVEAAVPTEGDGARRERLARACDAVRDRLYKGSSFGPFALEGWVVELWLGSKRAGEAPLRESAALGGLVGGGKLVPGADEVLAGIRDGTVEITDGFDAGAAQRSPGWSAAKVVFHEGYARAFLEEEGRARFLALADRVARASGADHAALYARCAHLETHDVGAWFRGPDAAGAAAMMVYQMGFFAETKVVDRSAVATLRPSGHDGGAALPGGELDALRQAAGDVAVEVPRQVSSAGGSVTTAGGSTTLVFPLGAPVRSLAATRELARRMGIGVPGRD